jgi:hypothetical protein
MSLWGGLVRGVDVAGWVGGRAQPTGTRCARAAADAAARQPFARRVA